MANSQKVPGFHLGNSSWGGGEAHGSHGLKATARGG